MVSGAKVKDEPIGNHGAKGAQTLFELLFSSFLLIGSKTFGLFCEQRQMDVLRHFNKSNFRTVVMAKGVLLNAHALKLERVSSKVEPRLTELMTLICKQ